MRLFAVQGGMTTLKNAQEALAFVVYLFLAWISFRTLLAHRLFENVDYLVFSYFAYGKEVLHIIIGSG